MAAYRYNVGLFFRAVVEAAGDAAALVAADVTTSYRQLNALSNRVAVLLRRRGARRGDVVAIAHDKSVECYAVMLAALKLGITYVNLDDQNPPARLEHIFQSARPALLVGRKPRESLLDATNAARIPILEISDPLWEREVQSASEDEPDGLESVIGTDPAYIMYTSGSTGVPKGAIITHANVLNFGAWIGSRFGVTASDVMSNLNPMYFDNSVFDFYGAILNGAALAPVRRETLSDPRALLDALEAARCTIWFSVPSLLIFLMTMKVLTWDRLQSVRSFVFGGEGYPKPELRKLFAAYGGRSKLINVYGPTECTCMCSAWDVREEDLVDDGGLVTLGPISENFRALVLDGDRPVASGETGELCLLGPQVGLGYVNDNERTQRAFVQNPLNDSWPERMYRSGDLVRLAGDGMLDFVGRRDNQIKHMGYRIELEEIEAALYRVAGVSRCAVLQKLGKRDVKLIVAYVVSESGTTEAALRSELEAYLPPYMIPQRFVVRDDLPKNANGKIDKVALSAENTPL